MTYEDRVKLYKKIEEIRKRPLIAYITSLRQNAEGVMASDVIPEFCKQINAIPEDEKEIDILIISLGGDPTVSWRIISILREKYEKIGVLLPYAAYSAATLLVLGADEIIMHPFSNLGPVDPQLMYIKKDTNEQIQFGSEDLRHFLDFVRKDVGISDQEYLEKTFEFVCKDVGTIPIGIAKRSSYLALSMGEKLLSLHMKDQSRVKTIVEALNKSFYHHGYPVGRNEAREIGLNVINPEKELESLMWQVWEDKSNEMKCNVPFDPLQIILSDENARKIIEPVPFISNLPVNLPSQFLAQFYQSILQQTELIHIEPLHHEVFNATLESTRCRSEFKTKNLITAARLSDMKIVTRISKITEGWKFYANDKV